MPKEELEAKKVDEETTQEAAENADNTGEGEKDVALLEEGQEETQETEEVEIVREGSQPSKAGQSGFRKRINKLNAKIQTANDETNVANTENARLREENRVLQQANQAQQNQQVLKKPNPDEFDLGAQDPEYQRQDTVYTTALVQKEVARQVSESTKQSTVSTGQNQQRFELVKKQEGHYERASTLKVKDYSDTEDKAIEALGNDVVNQIISNFDDSPQLLYYLGKNPQEAERIASLIDSNPIQGVAEIGRLRSEIKIKPKTKDPTPNPDEQIEGGGGAATNSYQRKLDKLREEATKGDSGVMGKILALKKEAREKGVELS